MLESSRLLKIKTILRIVISVLVIFSMLRSCAKAYTVDQFLEYAEQVKNDTNAPAQFRTNCTSIVNKSSLFKTKLAGYSNIIVSNMSTTGWLDIRCYNNTIPVTQYNNSSITFNGSQSGTQFRWTPRK